MSWEFHMAGGIITMLIGIWMLVRGIKKLNPRDV